jgi:hypothetical protein
VTEPERRGNVSPTVKRTNWTIIALIGGLVLLVLLVAYFATNRNSDQDKLTANEVATTTAPSREKLCASNATYALIKSELFRRAAQQRGGDQAAYDQISTSAVVRMENPVMESQDNSTQAVNCSGSLSLDLPPGVAVSGGRRTLMSDVDYTVEPAADGNGATVVLHNADAIIGPLATLERAEQPPAAAQPEMTNDAQPSDSVADVPQSNTSTDQPQPDPATGR